MFIQKTTEQGFPYLLVDNTSATAKIALQGGHLFHYQQKDKAPLLWLSEKSQLTLGKPIRGGIPICWPWFGKHPINDTLPQHGFARTSIFELVAVNESNSSGTEVLLELKNDDKSLHIWPHHFCLQLRIIIASKLSLTLTTQNRDSEPFSISSALHSYFAVSHIDNVSVHGLDQLPFLDFLTQEGSTQSGPLHIRGETDRGYQNVTMPLSLRDQDQHIQIKSTGSHSCVVWNPWIEKSTQIADMTDDAYKGMLCVETANIYQDARTIVAGAQHSLHLEIT